ncbi:MAG: hypothetical protein ACI85O_003811 [Saprospiraceae bacterium]|jgi:hypothetical protein
MKLSKTYKKIIQIELNEISEPIITQLISKGKLPNFAKLNEEWTYLKTTSEEVYENIEPWIQWVTAHTGKTFDEHKIFRLSDVHDLEHKQIWEALSEKSIESGIIGSMNATRRGTEGGIFFPDPWAKKNEAYPDNLKPLWSLISSRVQGHATGGIPIKDALKGLQSCIKYKLPLSLYTKLATQMVGQKLNPKTKWKLAAYFDLMLAEIFDTIYKGTDFGYYTLFLNAVAHYQHHYWRNFDRSSFDPSITYPDIEAGHDPISFGYEMYDKIIGKVLDLADNNTLVIVASGLSQIPYTEKEEQGGMNYYRLNSHQEFAEKIGLHQSDFTIYPLMSRDWQIKYESPEGRKKAFDILTNLSINGENLFNIKENTEGYIFVETEYTKGCEDGVAIKNKSGEAISIFNDVFTNIAIKSGHHSGIGNLWLSDKGLRKEMEGKKIPLTSLYNLALNVLTKEHSSLVS